MKIYKEALKMLVAMVATFALASATHGAFVIVVAVVGICAALTRRFGLAICTYIIMTFMIVINPNVFPKSGVLWGWVLRLGPLSVGLALALAASLEPGGRHRLPLAWIFPFLGVACISAVGGWAPKISCLKIVNYAVFILGIWLGTQNIQKRPRDLMLIRAMFIALAVFLVMGSLALLPFPAYSYATSVQSAMAKGDILGAEYQIREMLQHGDKTLFCGVLNHSQALAPVLALTFAWLACDMLFVEKRIRILYASILCMIPPMLFMTRSRVAFTVLVASCLLIYFYTFRKIWITPVIKKRLGRGMAVFVLVLVVVAGIAQIRDGTISQWLRKQQDVQGDSRNLSEALAESRMELIEQSLYEFRRNPLFGSGFQVAWYHQGLDERRGIVLSASIEKGVLPTMVLGETGIVGSFMFVVFLIAFYIGTSRRHLYVTATLFTLLLVSNLGEASFFSPGGIGSTLYVLTVVGGFVIDTHLIYGSRWAAPVHRMFPDGGGCSCLKLKGEV